MNESNYDSEEARQKRRKAFYDKICWCGHAMGNRTLFSGECMLCDHQKAREAIAEMDHRMQRS